MFCLLRVVSHSHRTDRFTYYLCNSVTTKLSTCLLDVIFAKHQEHFYVSILLVGEIVNAKQCVTLAETCNAVVASQNLIQDMNFNEKHKLMI